MAVRFDEKSSRPGDDLVDRIPAAHRIEPGIADRVHRSAGEHPRIQRIGILDELVVEQRDPELAFSHRHSSRLNGRRAPRQRVRVKLKTAGRRQSDALSHVAARTSANGEIYPQICLMMRRSVACLARTGSSAVIVEPRPLSASTPRPPISSPTTGLDAFDVDSLAARVHCSRATIYRHVGGKAEIRDAVLVRAAARIVATVRRCRRRTDRLRPDRHRDHGGAQKRFDPIRWDS